MAWYRWKPYVPVAARRHSANRQMQALRKKGVDIQPVSITGRNIAETFWGKAWCRHIESFGDYANRLPRGRTYVRNGSVCHLGVAKGKVSAKVSGSDIYDVEINIKTLPPKQWTSIKRACSGQIGSLLELLNGRLSDNIMEVVTDRRKGLFPLPTEISLSCSCPDWARMCKHVAAVMYGVGARLDDDPALLFLLRGVDHEELIAVDTQTAVAGAARRGTGKRLTAGELSDVFGIDFDAGEEPVVPEKKKRANRSKAKKPAAKKLRSRQNGSSVTQPSRNGAEPEDSPKQTAAKSLPKRAARKPAETATATPAAKKPKAKRKPAARKK